MPIVPANANDYAKEPIAILDKSETYSVGDKVRINTFYLANYSGMESLANVDAEIVKITSRPIKHAALDKDERPMFVGKYGKRDVYDIVGLYIQYPNDDTVYVVSVFGYDKV